MGVIIFSRIVLLLGLCQLAYLHPIHVSVTSVEYSREENRFFTSFKIFTDDFETILAMKYGVTLKLGTNAELEKQEQYITKYITDSFGFFINGDVRLEPQFERKTMNEEAVWVYYTYKCNKDVASIKIRNEIMMDMFDDQTNLLIFKYYDFEKGYRFKKNNREVMIKIDS